MNKKLLNLFAHVLIGLPFLSLAINAMSWLRFGLDLPVYDDWRGYYSGQMHSLDLHYLFRPVNDTMTPLGFALDALAQRYLDGNSIAYQFLSMVVVLGGLLTLQWQLLRKTLGDTILVSACFVLTLLMVQPGSYWGLQNMAYHQALPLLFILSIFLLVLSKTAQDLWRMPLIFFLALMSGFVYISGAFSILVVGLSFIAIFLFYAKSTITKTMFRSGIVLSLVGVFSSIIQYTQAISGADAHGSGAVMALPYEGKFWYYFFGKIGRSLLLPENHAAVSLMMVLLVCFITCVLAIGFLRKSSYWHQSGEQTFTVGAVFFVLASFVFVYLLMVSAGRVNLKTSDVTTPQQIFLYGFQRFHFFWPTLLWPWLVAALIVSWQALAKPSIHTIRWTAIGASTSFAVFTFGGGGFSHTQHYRAGSQYRLPTLACLSEQLQHGDKIDCPEFFSPDFRTAFTYGTLTGASFVRHFPILPVPLGSDQPPPWFRLSQDESAIRWRNASRLSHQELHMQASVDPQMWLTTEHGSEMSRCLYLDVNVLMQVTQPDVAQFYYRTLGASEFTEAQSMQLQVSAGGFQPLRFHFFSPTGFADGFRFDPVYKEQQFAVKELELRCRLITPLITQPY